MRRVGRGGGERKKPKKFSIEIFTKNSYIIAYGQNDKDSKLAILIKINCCLICYKQDLIVIVVIVN